MQLAMLSSGGFGAPQARSLLYRALHRYQVDGYIAEDVDLVDLEKRYKNLFLDDDWARLPIVRASLPDFSDEIVLTRTIASDL